VANLDTSRRRCAPCKVNCRAKMIQPSSGLVNYLGSIPRVAPSSQPWSE
jgi:hypothetical protein